MGIQNQAYVVTKADGYIQIQFSGDLLPDQVKQFETEIPTFFQEPHSHIVINCDKVVQISKPWIESFKTLHSEIKNIKKEIRFIIVPDSIKALFKQESVDQLFKVTISLQEALYQLGLTTKRAFDPEFINPFLHATVHVLKVQAATDAKAGKVYIKKQREKFSGDISGVIGLVNEFFSGSVVISFPETTFLKVMSRMLGEEYTTLTNEMTDGAGELTNIIFGQAKVALNEKGFGIKTALPSVVTGKDHSVLALTNTPIVVVPFETDVGPFFVEICLSN